MRAELYKIGCTNCDLDEILLEGGSKYIYEGEPIKKPAMVNYGYCKKCNRIDKILEPFTIKHLNLSVKEFVSLNQENESQSFFSKMLSSVSPELKSATEKVKREEGRLSYLDRKSTRLNSSHVASSYAVFCLKKKKSDNDEGHRPAQEEAGREERDEPSPGTEGGGAGDVGRGREERERRRCRGGGVAGRSTRH